MRNGGYMKRILALLLLLPTAPIAAEKDPKIKEVALKKEISSKEKAQNLEDLLAHLTYKTSMLVGRTEIFGNNPYFTTPHAKSVTKLESLFHSHIKELEGLTIPAFIGKYLYIQEQIAVECIFKLLSEVEKIIDLKNTQNINKERLSIAANFESIQTRTLAIIKQYKKMSPQIKDDSKLDRFKRLLLLNQFIRPLKFSDAPAWGAMVDTMTAVALLPAALYRITTLENQVADAAQNKVTSIELAKIFCKLVFIPLAAKFSNLVICSYAPKLDEYRDDLIKRDQLKEMKNVRKAEKKIAFSFVHYEGGGAGFAQLKNIQEDTILEKLEEYRDWLLHPLKYYEKLSDHKRALLLHGKPGNGKSEIVTAIADETNVPVVNITPEDVQNEKALQTKLRAGELLAIQNNKKAVIYQFDEIDLAAANRVYKGEKQQNNPQKEYGLYDILTELQGMAQLKKPCIRKLYVFSTNYIEHLDIALKRPGRIDDILHVKQPSPEQRMEMFRQSLGIIDQPSEKQLELLQLLKRDTEGFDRSDIVLVFKKASRKALQENHVIPTIDHLTKAIIDVRQNKIQANSSSNN